MRNFSSIETVTWIDGPAAVDLKTGVLYINPVHFDKLSNVAKRFVIFHELGHLNASTDSEEAADEWAFEHMIDLGNSNVELLKAFYKSLPFSNKAQINRAEQMLINALETDASTGNELAGKMAAYLGEPIPRNTGNMRGFLASLIIGGLSDLAAGIFTGKKTNKAEAKKQDEARQLAEEAEYESKSLALQSEYEIQLAKKMKEEEDLAQLAKNEQSTAAVKKYIFAGIGIVVLITVGIVVFKKMN